MQGSALDLAPFDSKPSLDPASEMRARYENPGVISLSRKVAQPYFFLGGRGGLASPMSPRFCWLTFASSSSPFPACSLRPRHPARCLASGS